ncbi:MAG: iron-sulfur cluster assembly accessory protein [Alphaproteobacteria bacterium]|nr:iron-sulfur cluster assembly accessory protein [Alphaproteobacteria bacterium]MDD9919124.1 iron-sulfur cluster assembly accessory protein [Alphaproteobacteria bacterium]
MNKAPLTLTSAAVARIQELIAKEPDILGLRIGVTTKGCSGFVHTLDYAKTVDETDTRIDQDGVTVFITSQALPVIFGTEMDWVTEELEQRFTFKNPNAKGTCGCGESFHIN